LSDTIGYYVFHAEPQQLEALRATLEQARNEIKQKPDEGEDPINGASRHGRSRRSHDQRRTLATDQSNAAGRLRDGDPPIPA
jgi:hypothetical protein